MAAIIQTLLVENAELRKTTMKFIGNYFISSKVNLKELGIIDFLMTCINEKTGEEALSLLGLIQAATEDYNSDLDFKVFSNADQELINTNDKIKNSLFLRYLPVPFVKFIVETSKSEQILAVYMKDSLEDTALIWSKDMRILLKNTLALHMGSFKKQLGDFVCNKTVGFRRLQNMPIYTELFKTVVIYPQTEKEIRCGEFYLRVWNSKKGSMENIHQIVFFNNLERTFKEITADLSKMNLDSLSVVMLSYTYTYIK